MNIFFLDTNIKKSIQYHCDKHVVKMILEYAQILSTCHHEIDDIASSVLGEIYKSTHKNHPSTRWTMAHKSHYDTVYAMLVSALEEYTHRYGKIHKTSRLLGVLKNAPNLINNSGIVHMVDTTQFTTLPPQCMGEQYFIEPKNPTDMYAVVNAYRAYYMGEKASLLSYKNRELPQWVIL